MDDDGAAWKLAAVYVVWLLASVAIALIAGLLVGAIATIFGMESQTADHQRLIAIVALIGFIVLAALPLLVHRRMGGEEQ
jgi:xanthosine utilization system XapX-like protein